jgi:hypothetical protein
MDTLKIEMKMRGRSYKIFFYMRIASFEVVAECSACFFHKRTQLFTSSVMVIIENRYWYK